MEAILDWNEMESRKLIEMLTEWATQKQFIYVHRWRKGDVVMWNNAWTMHKVMPYPIEHEPRVVHGVTILEFDLAH
jgi:alpha-ketoglutarate-dependent taurine dioxygenase